MFLAKKSTNLRLTTENRQILNDKKEWLEISSLHSQVKVKADGWMN